MTAVYRVVNREAAARGAALPAVALLLVEACSGLPRCPNPGSSELRREITKTQQQQQPQQGARQQGAPRPTRWSGTLPQSLLSSSSAPPLFSSSFLSSKRDAIGARPWAARAATQQLQQRAGFSSRAGTTWDNLTLPVRQAQLREAKAIAQLLPHRASFFPQFSPHGIILMPKAVLQQQQQQQQQQASKGGAAATPAPQSVAAPAKAVPSVKTAVVAVAQPHRRSSASTLHDWGAEGDAELDPTKALHRLKLKQKLLRLRRQRRKADGGKGGSST